MRLEWSNPATEKLNSFELFQMLLLSKMTTDKLRSRVTGKIMKIADTTPENSHYVDQIEISISCYQIEICHIFLKTTKQLTKNERAYLKLTVNGLYFS